MASTTETTTVAPEHHNPAAAYTSVGIAHLLGERPQRSDAVEVTISSLPVTESRGLPLAPPSVPNPADWPVNVRGTPHYRPVNRRVRAVDAPLGQNGAEHTFLFFMLSGVQGISVSRRIRKRTRGAADAADT